ncbi:MULTISPECIES: TetR/AcrR family transcriptional regulator [Thermoactinomyces]|jgi:AcrR family transcriptional regulator|uniref:TetR/AcrR family transcriptional regulator n=1 Tax=Thermoactinomyces daqus TaxID=1329516 RepID=A0A7W2AIE3_9BACL|nr:MULTISPECIES: TetR/AcrR family transcriptional regulator [Thermoactinomyces]MBA4544152.1 TetR/AcrR family transcriptional regulator [Thermoactinomyces daqus]MBH8597070.1 TetR/AcrR family transcriptional regulator [Thermoactinomyces sp. CICC 10523]MBH8602630.1 TetR/AcrR family transcriptional regulator [Thermoactinomyces sp. CICC 10522]MBH8606259.1 TetR/AcrR family transcriptional regulator [Thermoactinomyces sp. CICC 10521]
MNNSGRNMRRRGDALSESIYDATIEMIQKVGYTNLTFQQIAQAAKTSRTVMYRRWKTKYDLIREIMVYKMTNILGGELIDRIEDTGSLRGDLLQLLTLYQSIYAEIGPEIMNAILFEIGQDRKKKIEIEVNATNKNILVMRKLLGFAKNRGEKIKEVSDATLTLPFDLIRVENLLRKDVIDRNRLELLVDEILLPVFLA